MNNHNIFLNEDNYDIFEQSLNYIPNFIQDFEINNNYNNIISTVDYESINLLFYDFPISNINYFLNDYILANNLNIYRNIISIKENIDEWNIKYRQILNENDRNDECPISYEKIEKKDKYVKCINCKYNISKNTFKIIFEIKKECPMCRSLWTNNIIYINDIDTNFIIKCHNIFNINTINKKNI